MASILTDDAPSAFDDPSPEECEERLRDRMERERQAARRRLLRVEHERLAFVERTRTPCSD